MKMLFQEIFSWLMVLSITTALCLTIGHFDVELYHYKNIIILITSFITSGFILLIMLHYQKLIKNCSFDVSNPDFDYLEIFILKKYSDKFTMRDLWTTMNKSGQFENKFDDEDSLYSYVDKNSFRLIKILRFIKKNEEAILFEVL